MCAIPLFLNALSILPNEFKAVTFKQRVIADVHQFFLRGNNPPRATYSHCPVHLPVDIRVDLGGRRTFDPDGVVHEYQAYGLGVEWLICAFDSVECAEIRIITLV